MRSALCALRRDLTTYVQRSAPDEASRSALVARVQALSDRFLPAADVRRQASVCMSSFNCTLGKLMEVYGMPADVISRFPNELLYVGPYKPLATALLSYWDPDR